jgi:hypothetical protein
MEPIDLTALPYEDWVTYVFDHECDAALPPLERTPWYLEGDFGVSIADPHVLVDYVGRMCLEFSTLAQRYTLQQLDQGISFVLSAAGSWFREYLLDARVPLETRVAWITRMGVVFSDFLGRSTVPVMENCFYMWWDNLSFDRDDRNEDMREMRQAMFESLVRILAIDDPRCQGAALHGLEHVGHPRSRLAVQE